MESLPVVQDHKNTLEYLECTYHSVLNGFEGSMFIEVSKRQECVELVEKVYKYMVALAGSKFVALERSLLERDKSASRINMKALNKINRQMMHLAKMWDGNILDYHPNIDDEELEDETYEIKQFPDVANDANWNCEEFLTNLRFAHQAIAKAAPAEPGRRSKSPHPQ